MFKVASLGNDFILLDYLENNSALQELISDVHWAEKVKHYCVRKKGFGADGVLILKNTLRNPELLLFNSDGSSAKKCFNGLRCAACYLHKYKQYSNILTIYMNQQPYVLTIDDNRIGLTINDAHYLGTKTITINNEKITGHIVDMGNPHFVILDNKDLDWLKQFGPLIEKHHEFSDRTNVEILSETKPFHYQLLIFERGCGITKACGTGAAAVICVLHQLNKIKNNVDIIIEMLGGELITQFDSIGTITQKTLSASCIKLS